METYKEQIERAVKDLSVIKKEIKVMDKNINEEEEGFKVAVLLLSAVGLQFKESGILSKITGYNYDWVKMIARRLRQNGIWKDGKTYCNWTDKKTGGVAFWTDVNCGLGYIERKVK